VAPANPDCAYTVARYSAASAHAVANKRPFDLFRYYFSPKRGVGYVFYRDLGGAWADHNGKWFRASLQVDRVMRRLLAQHGVRIPCRAAR
jgi:hypothetical protein